MPQSVDGRILGFTRPQLDHDHEYGGVTDNQLRTLSHVNLISLIHHDRRESKDSWLYEPPQIRLTNPYNAAASLNDRARSYLHVNCAIAISSQPAGLPTSTCVQALPSKRPRPCKLLPSKERSGSTRRKFLSPGDPYRSVLFYRLAKQGRGRMPYLGSELVDPRGLRLIHDWIRQLPLAKDKQDVMAKLRERVCAAQGAEAVDFLSSTYTAVMLAEAVAEGRLAAGVRAQVLVAAMANPDPQVRDLFERFVPDDQRPKRLGSIVKVEDILAMNGSLQRGKELFFKSPALQCLSCHRVAGTGSVLGPDLTDIAKKYTRAQILESILEPSKFIDPKYVTYMVETSDGKVHTGLLAEKTAKEVVLRMAGDKEVRIPAGTVSLLAPQQISLMPELLCAT